MIYAYSSYKDRYYLALIWAGMRAVTCEGAQHIADDGIEKGDMGKTRIKFSRWSFSGSRGEVSGAIGWLMLAGCVTLMMPGTTHGAGAELVLAGGVNEPAPADQAR